MRCRLSFTSVHSAHVMRVQKTLMDWNYSKQKNLILIFEMFTLCEKREMVKALFRFTLILTMKTNVWSLYSGKKFLCCLMESYSSLCVHQAYLYGIAIQFPYANVNGLIIGNKDNRKCSICWNRQWSIILGILCNKTLFTM